MSDIHVVTIAEQGLPGPPGPQGPLGLSGSGVIRNIDAKQFQALKGVTAKFGVDTDIVNLDSAKLDILKADGVNFIWLCFEVLSSTQTGSALTVALSKSVYTTLYNLVKSKGFMVGFKPHVTWNGSGTQYNPSDLTAFFANYTAIFNDYLACGATWDYISISNELSGITVAGNLSQWSTLANNSRVSHPEAKILCSCAFEELATNGLTSLVDYIGCNLYPSLTKSIIYTADDLVDGLFRGLEDYEYINMLNNYSGTIGKKIIVTEIGCVPYADAMAATSGWTFLVYDQTAQAKYYQAFFETIQNMENVFGICIHSVTDSFTFIGNLAEAVVQSYWGNV